MRVKIVDKGPGPEGGREGAIINGKEPISS